MSKLAICLATVMALTPAPVAIMPEQPYKMEAPSETGDKGPDVKGKKAGFLGGVSFDNHRVQERV